MVKCEKCGSKVFLVDETVTHLEIPDAFSTTLLMKIFSVIIRILWLFVCNDHAVGKTDNKGAADEDDKIRGKKCHQKRKRIVKFIGRNEQPDAKI